MLRRIKSKHYLPFFVSMVLLIFAMHFVIGTICRVNPDPKVSDRFDAYLRPGVLVLFVLAAPFPRGLYQGNMLGVFVYFGAMLLYSVLLTLALFGIYEVLRKVIKMKTPGQRNSSPSNDEEPQQAPALKSKGRVEQTSYSSFAVEDPRDRIVKWWTIITLAADIAILALVCLFLAVRFESARKTGPIMDMLILFYHMVKEAGGIAGAIYLLIFGSNVVLLARSFLHRCGDSRQVEEQVKIHAVKLGVVIKLWTALTILIDVAAVVFPLLTLFLRRPGTEGSHAAMAGELYPTAGSASGLTATQSLHFCVFLWTVIFASNTFLLIRSLFHQCNEGRPVLQARHACEKLRAIGLLYLVLGAAFILFAMAVLLCDYEYYAPHV